MKNLQYLFSSEFIEAIGWTIVHSIWQGVIVAIVLAILLLFMRRNSAQLKYIISFFALLIIIGWSGITFANAFSYAKEKSVLKENITSNPEYIKTYFADKLAQASVENGQNAEVGINLRWIKIRSFFQRNFNLICFIWIVGMLFLIVKMIGGFIYVRRLRRYQLVDIGEEWILKIEEYAHKLNLDRKVAAFFSPLANVPLTLGTIKPVILFPVAAFTGLSVKDVEAIIAHELAHIIRHDYLFNILQSIVEILFFYHPAVWMISAQIRSERENSCDNIAIQLTGDKVAYVKALAAVQINQMEQGQLAMAFASPKSSLLQRIKRLQKKVAMKTNFIEGLIAAGVIVVGLALVSFTVGNKVAPQVMPTENTLFDTDEPGASNAKPVWTKEMKDSVQQELEKNIQHSEELDQVSEEMKKMVEVAMSEQDATISTEMMEEINAALKEINVGEIIQEAMQEVQKAMQEAHESIDYDEIHRDMEDARRDIEEARKEIRESIDHGEIRRDLEEARKDIQDARKEMREDMRRDMENDNVPEEIIELSIGAAEAGLNAAAAVLENLPLDEIIHAALRGVEVAAQSLDEIDFDQLKKNDSISEEDIARLKKQLEKEEEKLKLQKEKLKEKEKELKKTK
ncbi:MAG: M56 family metallopeptidase [Prolixibacteraceae bacterium]